MNADNLARAKVAIADCADALRSAHFDYIATGKEFAQIVTRDLEKKVADIRAEIAEAHDAANHEK